MKKFTFLTLMLAFGMLAVAQQQANFWYFGDFAGVNFQSGTPVALTNGSLITDEGCSSISREDGSLAFYTDGGTIWDASHSVMQNGAGLLGNFSSGQSAVVVPAPNNDDRYYVFTVDASGGNDGLNYSIVDMTLNGGLGGVINGLKNIFLVAGAQEKLSAVLHQNGTDVWVTTVAPGPNSAANNRDTVYAFRIVPFGVLATAPTITPLTAGATTDSRGTMKISPNGELLTINNVGGTQGMFMYDFDNATGAISNSQVLTTAPNYGSEFSPCTQYLYAVESSGYNSGPRTLVQYDLFAPSVAASRSVISTAGNGGRGSLQLGPDGKVYVARGNNPFLGVIENPESPAASIIYDINGVDLLGRPSKQGLPPFIQSYFEATFEITNDANVSTTDFCEMRTVNFELEATCQVPTSAFWQFGDGNTSTLLDPTHTYMAPGVYDVTVQVTLANGDIRNLTDQVEVFDTPDLMVPQDIYVCDADGDGMIDVTYADFDADVLGGQDPAVFNVSYYASQADADAAINPLPAFEVLSGSNQVFVRAENTGRSECFDTDNFNILIDAQPTSSAPANIELCDTDGDGSSEVNLSTFNNTVLGGQSTTEFSVAYYPTQMDAEMDTNEITAPVTITNGAVETIFLRVNRQNSVSCFSDVDSFTIGSYAVPTAVAPADEFLCDSDGDGVIDIDLTQYDALVYNGQSTTDFTIDYFGSQADADANTNALGTNLALTSTQTIVVRLSNAAGSQCNDTQSFTLQFDPLPTANVVADFDQCDESDDDGFTTFNLSDFDTQVIGGQTGPYTVTYYASQADADAGVNPLPSTFTNTQSGGQAIYARIQSANTTECFSTTAFMIEVTPPVSIGAPATFTVCDEAPIDGISEFDLSTQDASVLGNQSSSDFTVSYHETEQDAIDNVDPLGTFYTNTVADMQTIYARLTENNSDCFNVQAINLEVELCELIYPQGFSPNGDGINDTFEILGLEGQFPDYEMTIFNRQGIEIYKGRAGMPAWNGTGEFGSQETSSLLPVGTYFYVIKFNSAEVEDVADWVYMNY